MLHLVQSEDGYVSPRGIAFCAGDARASRTAEVSAVATFYTQYKRHPNGEYTVGVCTNTLCAVMGGDAIWEHLSDHLGVGHDETTDDGAITLERIECNAACDYAPVVMVNWEFFDNQTPESAAQLVDALRAGEQVAPTRGAASVLLVQADVPRAGRVRRRPGRRGRRGRWPDGRRDAAGPRARLGGARRSPGGRRCGRRGRRPAARRTAAAGRRAVERRATRDDRRRTSRPRPQHKKQASTDAKES